MSGFSKLGLVGLMAALGALVQAQGKPEATVLDFGYESTWDIGSSHIVDSDLKNELVSDKIIQPGFANVFKSATENDTINTGMLTGTMTESNHLQTTWDPVTNSIHNQALTDLTNINLLISNNISIVGNLSDFSSVDTHNGISNATNGVTSSGLVIDFMGQTFTIASNEPQNTVLLDTFDAQHHGVLLTYGLTATGTSFNSTDAGARGLVFQFSNFNDNGTILNGEVGLGGTQAGTSNGAVPEPASMSALAFGGLGLLMRRKRKA